jgi:hypothetical protein
MHKGLIYFLPNYVGQIQSEKGLHQRYKGHRRSHPDWPEPKILEKVTGRSRSELLFNLSWQETMWIFKMKTLREIWSDGLNVRAYVPPVDCHLAGKIGGSSGARIIHQRYSKKKIRDWCSKAGKIGSKVTNALIHQKKDVLGRSLVAVKASEAAKEWMKNHPKEIEELNQRASRARSKALSRVNAEGKGGKRGNHNRWHEARGVINLNCKFCKEKK